MLLHDSPMASKDLVGVNLRHAHAEVAVNPSEGLGFLAVFKSDPNYGAPYGGVYHSEP